MPTEDRHQIFGHIAVPLEHFQAFYSGGSRPNAQQYDWRLVDTRAIVSFLGSASHIMPSE